MDQILKVIGQESRGSWTEDFQFISYYNWTGFAGSLSPPVKNGGNGDLKKANGLVSSHHRPSDDLCVFSKWSPMLQSRPSNRQL